MLENNRSQLLWNVMHRNPYIISGLKKAGFKGGWLDKAPMPLVNVETEVNTLINGNPEVPLDPKAFFERGVYRENIQSALPYRFVRPLAGLPKSFSSDYAQLEGNSKQYFKNEKTADGKVTAQPAKFPLVIFLHGSGERGTDNEAQLKNAVLAFVEKENYQKNPCFLLVPQCPEEQNWGGVSKNWGDITFQEKIASNPEKLLLQLIDSLIIVHPAIDKDRIYIMGLSMGGFGTFDLLSRRPGFFAAGMPLCGGGDPKQAERIKNIPMWIMHGTRDEAVNPKLSRDMVTALRAVGSTVKYTEYGTLGHGIWEQVLYNPEVMTWLFAQKKK
jgi:predicted peptidase